MVPLVIPLMIYVNAPRFVDPLNFGFMLGLLVSPDLGDEIACASADVVNSCGRSSAQRVVVHDLILPAVSDY